ncbi:MAG: glycosyltransferase family 39 protein [bacterium]
MIKRIRNSELTTLNSQLALVTLAVLIGFIFRLWGINYGFPSLFFVDDYIFVKHSLGMGTTALNPHWFIYPHLFMYILFFAYGLFYIAGKLIGVFPDLEHFFAYYALYPWRFHQIGRFTSVLFATATILIVYLIARRAGKGTAGIVAALMLALMPLHVNASHFCTAEPTMVFFTTLSLLFIMLYQSTFRSTNLHLAVVCASAAVMTKYNAGLLIIPIVWVLVENLLKEKNWRKTAAVAFACLITGVITSFIFSPYVFIDFKSFWREISIEYGYLTREGWLGYENVGSGPLYHLYTLMKGLTVVGSMFAAGGIILVFVRRKRILLPGTVFSLIYYFYVSSWKIYHAHYMLPILPFLCVLAGYFISEVSEWIKSRYSKNAATVVTAVLLAACFIPMVCVSANIDIRYNRRDIRLDAAEWVFKNIPQNSTIAMESWSLDLGISRTEIKKKYDAALKSNPALAEYYAVKLKKYPFSSYVQHNLNWAPTPSYSQQLTGSAHYTKKWLEEQHIDYVIINSNIYERYNRSGKVYPVQMKFYEFLDREAKLLKVFTPNGRPGPIIKIYSLRHLN